MYDLLCDWFTLLRLSSRADPTPFVTAATAAGIPLHVVDLGRLPRLRAVCEADLVLVRPDQHVAWRGDVAADPAEVWTRVIGGGQDRDPGGGSG
ncbi:aromatic-ring hydroxylase C-terminal domain-containing protein [Nonomuraea recticatena]|uniref:aromatic-ring hydroxylase C-terminal domain-containing protein n=1 Tax=Nonomuraea recticatena TaxID=46178 RepID=UPI003623A116